MNQSDLIACLKAFANSQPNYIDFANCEYCDGEEDWSKAEEEAKKRGLSEDEVVDAYVGTAYVTFHHDPDCLILTAVRLLREMGVEPDRNEDIGTPQYITQKEIDRQRALGLYSGLEEKQS